MGSILGVSLRSVMNNGREALNMAIALRMGPTKAAAWLLMDSMSLWAYSVSNLAATGAMMVGGRLRGQRRLRELQMLLKDYRLFAILTGAVFVVITAAGKSFFTDAYSNDIERDQFEDILDRIYWLGVIRTFARVQVGAYGPLLMTTQQYMEWGYIVATLIVLVWLPFLVAAGVTQLPEVLVIGDTGYLALHCAWLYYRVFVVAMQQYSQMAATPTEGPTRCAVEM